MSQKNGTFIQLSFDLINKSKQAMTDFLGLKKNSLFVEPVKREEEHELHENYNSFRVHDVSMLRNQPMKDTEFIPKTSVTDQIQEKIIELRNIFAVNKEALEKEKESIIKNNKENEEKKHKNNNDWQPM